MTSSVKAKVQGEAETAGGNRVTWEGGAIWAAVWTKSSFGPVVRTPRFCCWRYRFQPWSGN